MIGPRMTRRELDAADLRAIAAHAIAPLERDLRRAEARLEHVSAGDFGAGRQGGDVITDRHPNDHVWRTSKIVASYFRDHMGNRRAQLIEFMAVYCIRELPEVDRAIRWLVKHGIIERFKRSNVRYANANRYMPTTAGLKWLLENER